MHRSFMPEGRLFTGMGNRRILSSRKGLEEAAENRETVEAFVSSCDIAHNLTVDLGTMKGVIPRTEGAIGIAEGTVRDIALISRVGKPVSFIIEDFTEDNDGRRIALLSRKKAQERCKEQYIKNLRPGDIIPARITHLESFGAFCDIGCGIIALLPIDTISVSRISHPKDRFECGNDITVIVKSIIGDKITLSQKELLGTWQENADCFAQGETVPGIIRSVEDYGVFVELTPNLAGLAEIRDGVRPGQKTSVYIKSILPEKMKVKLIIIDLFLSENIARPIKYFIQSGHIDRWQYSPEHCDRLIYSEF